MGFVTKINFLEEYTDNSFVIALGKVKIPSNVPRSKKMYFPSVSEKVLEVIQEIDPILLKEGVIIIIGKECYSSRKIIIDRIQRHLAFLYAKFIDHPTRSETIPDLLGVRKGKNNVMILREICKAANLPIYVRAPLCDKIEALRIGLPVIILGPGPSLKSILPHLIELKQRALIVCVTRVLPILREYGISPDFALLLDSSYRMAHFTPQAEKWENTYLISLSVANISQIVNNFRGVFLFDSFDLNYIPNTYRLRESWLSCVLAALGLAEALHAPDVYLAGMDSCWYDSELSLNDEFPANSGSNPVYAKNTAHDISLDDVPFYPPDEPIKVCAHISLPFHVPDVTGRIASTFFTYFAIAHEAEIFAREISKTVGTNFHLLNDQGILNSEVFNINGERHLINNYSLLDRNKVYQILDNALLTREKFDYDAFIANTKDLIRIVEAEACRIGYCLATEDDEGVKNSFLYDSLMNAVKNMKFPAVFSKLNTENYPELTSVSNNMPLRSAVESGHKWAKLLHKAVAQANLFKNLELGKPIQVFSLPDEVDLVRRAAETQYCRYFPNSIIKVVTCYVPSAIEGSNPNYPLSAYIDKTGSIGHTSSCLHVFLPGRLCHMVENSCALVSKKLYQEFSYVLDLLPADRWILLE
ncbi:6-hydroxymethylpterin diphosphokinase MptE-like protein [Desulfovibrio gilichinskyi]|uniref:6-hydroxymethylpterin diphosphokinase MptE-like domain-containing protein n=1 Tax=Desulfovibrio gilichinskyi TaxID=1519643 RepID=A0A1X7EBA1_9BACT|nr:6-hydroxymethylpterin diphosphokinase MptE-like protein [Desulfovibrio gilichinskyi]SMF30559.1 Protein of unknown function DUF115 [Desulfovibrio gilichinskyi]